ncbi:hypothetical protein [Algiphilus sp.]|uniref:hypothetical protein n=1 Tax=Algiphilus sp. TaxID=1872431 RepID=UPI001CA6141B|nr:hypothetical protein [Algiphilus sp.]MBY8964766.1 hypothetical protein [Algiphilus acroporae]MCI5061576.1 hypothetical protein [Algiphilus sp.]MCI5103665.1 hypothetical protein [Algiphilus sp.]MCR9091784.1 hypothetical protein [Pseudomonadota bacterium]
MSNKGPNKDDKTKDSAHEQEIIDEALDETFPASDPPATTTTTDDLDREKGEEKK